MNPPDPAGVSISELTDTQTAILGATGAGKTVTAKGHVEALLDAGRHVCVLDPTGAWYGLRSAADGHGPGFDIPIFGGRHGDVEITADMGEAVASIVAGGVSAIVDISDLRTGAEQRRFARDLCRRLRAKPNGNFHFVVDEADEFAAQKPRDDYGFQVGEELIWMAKRGRLPGFVLTLITQRPASIDKEVLSQAQTLIVHQLVAPVDQKPVIDYLKDHADKATLAQIKGSLASLERGERWIYSPRLGVLERGLSPMPRTFDSSRTPEPGEQTAEPKMLANIDLAAIRKALASAGAMAIPKTTESAHVAGLEIGTTLLERDTKIAELIRANAECATFIADQIEEIEALRGALSHADDALGALRREIATALQKSDSNLAATPGRHKDEGKSAAGTDDVGTRRIKNSGTAGKADSVVLRPIRDGETAAAHLNASAEKMLAMLERIAPAHVTWASLAAMVGNKARGGNFNAARKGMRESGLISEEGDSVRFAGASLRAGMSREAARCLWKGVLSSPAPQMIDALQVKPMTRSDLGHYIGIVPRGGHFNNGVAQCLRNGVAVDIGGVLHLADPLPGESV